MARVLREKIIDIKQLKEDIINMTIYSDYICSNALPGQFVNVKCSDGMETVLRRPISISNVNRNNKTFEIIFQVKGKGTEILAGKNANASLDIIGPLGKPFETTGNYKKVAIIAGGIGVFPLLFLIKEMVYKKAGSELNVFLGFKNKDTAILTDEISKMVGGRVKITTDDGSMGQKGVVTELLTNELNTNKFDMLYTCGPLPMLKATASIAERFGLKCQLSLEQRMGCGIGACLVCSCKTKVASENDWTYARVCKDGPVFWSTDIIFD